MVIDPDRRLSYFRLNGHLRTCESEQAFVDYTKHPDFDPTFTLLSNTAPLEGIDSSFREVFSAVMRVRSVMNQFETPVKSIIYTASGTAFGMGRVLQQVAEPVSRFNFVITMDEAEALAEAGQPESDFASLEEALGRGKLVL